MLAQNLLIAIPRSIRVIRRLASECLGGSLTFGQLRILFLINEGLSTTQMAEALQVSVAATSKMINLLLKRQLINKQTGQDRRVVKLALTRRGKKLLKLVSAHVEGRLNRGIKELNSTQQYELDRGIKVLEHLMELVDV